MKCRDQKNCTICKEMNMLSIVRQTNKLKKGRVSHNFHSKVMNSHKLNIGLLINKKNINYHMEYNFFDELTNSESYRY